MLDGEAYAQGRGKDFVLEIAPLAGVKKKRQPSEAQRRHLEYLKASRIAPQESPAMVLAVQP